MRIRSVLSVAVAAAAGLALATPAAQAADTGDYRIRDARTNLCVEADGNGPGRLAPCSPKTEWTIRVQDGSNKVQFVDSEQSDRCLALSPLMIYPPIITTGVCGGHWATTWSVDGPIGAPSTISLGDRGNAFLTVEDDRLTVLDDDAPRWILERVA